LSSLRLFVRALLGFSVFTLFSGCAGSPVAPLVSTTSHAIQGVVHGGQQPVTGADIQLYAVGTSGDASAATSLMTSSVQTDASGNFSLNSKYNCPGSPANVYLVSTGGNPGLSAGTNNTAIVMMAALGLCSSLNSSTFVSVDEVTTIGSVAALYPYMTSATNLGSGSSDSAAFGTAFGNVAEYTNTATGTAPGTTLPVGMYASSTEINTLGNIVAPCINSAGGIAGDLSACGNLFNLTKSGSTAPTSIIGAILNILNNPTQNASSLFDLGGAITPFQPVLSSAPSTWALPILPIAATPSISIAGGAYSSAQFVTLSDTSTGATIRYTTDGSTPTASSIAYSGTITVSSTETLKAIALGGGFASSPVASASYTITGSTQTYSVGGQFHLTTGCGGGFIPPITVTLTHGTTVVQTTNTSNGSFTFTNVPIGNYVITPSITGPTALFYPATQIANVTSSNLNFSGFSAALGYTVSGTVAYGGSQTGPTYLALNSTSNCGSGGTEGTSVSTKGAFTIHGVPPGAYTLQSFMDNIGKGVSNGSNPAGSTSVNVTSANLTGQDLTLNDPGTVTLTTAPTIQGAAGFNNAAIIQYKPITLSNVEQPTSYTLQWSTDPTFTSITGSKIFQANGTKANAWFLNGLANTTTLPTYFRATAASAGTAAGTYYSSVFGPVNIGAPTAGNTVTGAITFSTAPTGPLYVAFVDQNSGSFYAQYIANPVSSQAYSIQVPSGSYQFFAIMDQNNNGLIDTGDVQDATENGNGNTATTVISGPTSNLNLTLPSAAGSAVVTTQNYNSISSSGTTQNYNLSFQVNGVLKLPIAATLTSGPNLISPVDIAVCGGSGSSCSHGFQIYFGIGATTPVVGDSYTFNVTYSDRTSGIVTAAVNAVLTAFPTSLLPQTGTSTSLTPTFTWTDPLNASNYTYQFYMNNSGGTVWQIPGTNSKSPGFSSAITSISWGTDPTGEGSTPTGNLTHGTAYNWQITVQDSLGNSAATQVQYQP